MIKGVFWGKTTNIDDKHVYIYMKMNCFINKNKHSGGLFSHKDLP